MNKRDSFSGKLGFVLAAAGSAVGLGNIWRFPYLVAKYGGGIFLFIYLILVLTFGYSIMTLEISIGRKTRQSPVGAFKAFSKKYVWVGVLSIIVPLIISGYYGVIGGWVIKFLTAYIANHTSAAAQEGYFSSFASGTFQPIIFQLIFILSGTVILLGGVKGGIEKASKFCMPILLVLSIIIAVYTLTLPGALEGVKYILIPDFSKFGFQTVVGAMGQMFYSMSLAMGIMITFGSYLSKEDDIEKSVKQIEFFDATIAILATFMVVPAVFVFNPDPNKMQQGASLMFETLPKVFDLIPLGTIVGAAFFLLVAFAALTSYISILEVMISSLCDVLKLNRTLSVIICVAVSCLLGIPATLGNGVWSNILIFGNSILDFMDLVANSLLLPLVALTTCIIFGWFVGLKPLEEEILLSSKFKRGKIFGLTIKYIAPVFLGLIIVGNILQTLGIMNI